MRIEKTNNKKAKLIILAVVMLILLLVALGVYFIGFKGTLFGWTPFADARTSDINYGAPTKGQLNAGENIEKSTDKNSNSGKNPNDVGADHPNQPIQSGTSKASVAVTLSSANQNDGVLQIRAMIGVLTNEGTCTLTLTKSGKTVTRTADVQPLSNSTTCKGFDIPVAELSSGQWNARIDFENSTAIGTTTSTVKVL